MAGLIYKDIRTNLGWLLLIGGVVLGFNILMGLTNITSHELDFVGMKAVYYIIYAMVFFTCSAFALNYIQTDERKKWGYYIASIPNGIVKQVTAKYIFVALTIAFTFGACYVQNLISRKLNDEVASLTGVFLILACITFIIVALELPFAIAFGTRNGAYVKAGVFVMFVLMIVIYLLFGDISMFGSEEEFADRFLDKLSGLDLKSTGGRIILLGIPLYCISCFISTKLYLGGIERMEK
ncbi:MAG: ABC-2 transporter permease [Ruminococcus sp.]|nr:ABC-2 transporter permease [Ruminococcus sp.]